jgi:spore coat protein U-like protein
MRKRTIRFVLARVAAVGMLGIASLALASPANADVIANEHFTFTVTNMNPCAPEDGLLTLNFEEHRVTQQLADGTLVIHSNFHGTGSSTSGVEYVANRHQVTLVVGQTGSATFEVRRISKGPGDNVLIEGTRTFPPLVDTITFRCVG